MVIIEEVTHLIDINYANAQRTRFFTEMLSATISHDMKTPLNAILTMTKSIEMHFTAPKTKN